MTSPRALEPRHPDLRRHLLTEVDEQLLAEVEHHWSYLIRPVLEGCGALLLLVLYAFGSYARGWVWFWLAMALGAHACWLWWSYKRDVFAVTTKRVLRVRGPLNRERATMPLGRILDITVDKPLLGRMLGYGHLTFESAAQIQGLRTIRYVPDPDGIDRLIQVEVHSPASD